ncbi:MAG: sulfite exporter TauE/SafE family protein [Acidimicrobiia bacterium]|nr:sulfite exporter TauE/SafE family protein [Acidimicrobiia bacterium]MDH5292190.1 sulfite exporter TauE/SafE family protein [Acidimicrobiia bacterium]
MEVWEIAILAVGGLFAGAINAIAGGASLLTVPLLVLAGVPGNAANGSNRLGVITSSATAAIEFRRRGVHDFRKVWSVLPAVVAGSLVGSFGVSRLLDSDQFEKAFGFLMVPILILSLRKPKPRADGTTWPRWLTLLVFFGIGLYGGAFQAGIGLLLIVALSRSGLDLVLANSVKVLVNLAVSLVALPVFVSQGFFEWLPAVILATGFALGGTLGAAVSVKGGERVIRPVMILAVLALSGRLLGLYGS